MLSCFLTISVSAILCYSAAISQEVNEEETKMQINMHVDTMMRNFYQTGSLGQGAERTDLEGMDAMMVVMTRANDCNDIAVLDNTAGDNDKNSGIIDLRPEDAQKLVPSGFGPITSCRAEFKGPAGDLEGITAEIDGPESRKIVHMAIEGDDITIFEARSQGDKGLLTAGKIGKDKSGMPQGYMEMLEIPWHMAR
jgi:hypothetical protein